MKTEILLQNYSLHFGPQTEENTTVHTCNEIEIHDMYNDKMIIRNILEMVPLEQPTIDRPSCTVFTIHLLQKKGVLTSICCNLE